MKTVNLPPKRKGQGSEAMQWHLNLISYRLNTYLEMLRLGGPEETLTDGERQWEITGRWTRRTGTVTVDVMCGRGVHWSVANLVGNDFIKSRIKDWARWGESDVLGAVEWSSWKRISEGMNRDLFCNNSLFIVYRFVVHQWLQGTRMGGWKVTLAVSNFNRPTLYFVSSCTYLW